MKGNVLRCQIDFVIECNNVIPIQMINEIANITEISDDNTVNVVFAIDLALYAVELEVGIFVRYISI